MSLNLNKVILAGRLTADPELKVTPSNISVTSVTVAVDRPVAKDAEKKTDFINVVAWRGTAEFIANYFRKGSAICFVGSIQTRSYTDVAGNKRYVTEVLAEEARFVESKSSSGQTASAPTSSPAPAPYGSNQPAHFEEMTPDDDLPF